MRYLKIFLITSIFMGISASIFAQYFSDVLPVVPFGVIYGLGFGMLFTFFIYIINVLSKIFKN